MNRNENGAKPTCKACQGKGRLAYVVSIEGNENREVKPCCCVDHAKKKNKVYKKDVE